MMGDCEPGFECSGMAVLAMQSCGYSCLNPRNWGGKRAKVSTKSKAYENRSHGMGGGNAKVEVSNATNKVDLKQTGSYTNTHASGKTYVDKGSRQRSQKSGRREARRNDDPHVATDWTPADNNREAFKQESRRLDAEGGPSSSSNYNRIEQPGKKYRQQGGEL